MPEIKIKDIFPDNLKCRGIIDYSQKSIVDDGYYYNSSISFISEVLNDTVLHEVFIAPCDDTTNRYIVVGAAPGDRWLAVYDRLLASISMIDRHANIMSLDKIHGLYVVSDSDCRKYVSHINKTGHSYIGRYRTPGVFSTKDPSAFGYTKINIEEIEKAFSLLKS